MTSDAALGASASPANQLNIYICYQGGVTVVPWGGGLFGLTAAAGQRHTLSLSSVLTGLAAGTYNVGMCGYAAVPLVWNNNEYSYTSAIVLP